jgi:hypothetical protein
LNSTVYAAKRTAWAAVAAAVWTLKGTAGTTTGAATS